MPGMLETAGERLSIDCSVPWIMDLIDEGAAGELERIEASETTLHVQVEEDRRGFDVAGWELLTRGAWRRDSEVVIENVCTAGFDLHLRCTPQLARFTYRWRPPSRDRIAARLLRSRFHLLARATLMQYPVLWWAGTHGRAPLHATACVAGNSKPLLSAPSGIGRSTLLLGGSGSHEGATGDNLAVGDGSTVWGLVEPIRVEGGEGRRMPHGRQEAPMARRVDSLVPDCIVVLERGRLEYPLVSPCSADTAARSLVTSTYMAGELRRYWSFAATLSAGTGLGPSHPPIGEIASTFASRLPCMSLALGRANTADLSVLLETAQAAA